PPSFIPSTTSATSTFRPPTWRPPKTCAPNNCWPAMSDLRYHAGAAGAASATLTARPYHLDHEPHPENGTALGFWLYLMSDCLIFAALFATYGVLGRSYAAGPTGAQLFDLTLVAIN